MPTNTEYQNLIMVETGTADDSVVILNIPTWWSLYSDSSSGYIQYLRTRRHILIYLLGISRGKVDVAIGTDSWKNSQSRLWLLELLKATESELEEAGFVIGVATMVVTSSDSQLPGAIEEEVARYTDNGISKSSIG